MTIPFGIPLFVEELTKMVLESGWLLEQEGHYELSGPPPPLAIPVTLHDSLRARLDRLAMVKAIAQRVATLGRTFSYDLLHAVAPLEEDLRDVHTTQVQAKAVVTLATADPAVPIARPCSLRGHKASRGLQHPLNTEHMYSIVI